MRTVHWRGIGAFFLAVAAGACSSGGNVPSETSGEVSSGLGSNACTLTTQGDQVVRYVNVTVDGFTFEETRSVDLHSPGGGALSETGSIRHGSQIEFSYTATGNPDGTGTLNITWGHQVRGLESATMQIANGKLTGSINGRQFLPFSLDQDPKTGVFVDGKPQPQADFPGQGMLKQLARLDAAVQSATGNCEVVSSSSDDMPAFKILAAAAPAQDKGHFSDTYSTLRCDGCKAGVIAAATVTCGFVCVGTFGLGCGGCIAGATVGVPAGILLCENSKSCCPVACGGGFPGTCCFGDEACLNGDGLCCSRGTTTCAGKSCCASDQSCIDAGVNKGTCCKDSLLCGLNCCEDGETCFDSSKSQCCATGLVCGSTCCGRIDDKLAYCLDPQTGTCCSQNQVVCSGKCCDLGQICDGSGQCAAPPPPVCVACENNGDCDASVDIHNKCNLEKHCCQSTPF